MLNLVLPLARENVHAREEGGKGASGALRNAPEKPNPLPVELNTNRTRRTERTRRTATSKGYRPVRAGLSHFASVGFTGSSVFSPPSHFALPGGKLTRIELFNPPRVRCHLPASPNSSLE